MSKRSYGCLSGHKIVDFKNLVHQNQLEFIYKLGLRGVNSISGVFNKVGSVIVGCVGCLLRVLFEGREWLQAVIKFLQISFVFNPIISYMTQPAKRNPARDKKVPKYMQYDDTQYGLHSIPRALQSKEIRSSHLEINQLAKLFHRFVTNANQNYRDHHQKLSIQGGEAVEQSKLQMQNSKDIGRFNFQKKTNQDQKHYYNVSSRKPREHYERALLQQYKSNPKPETKKPNTIFKTPSSTPQNQSLSFKANKKDNPAISIENFKYSTEQSGLIKFTKEANQGRPAKSKQGKKKEAGQKPANEREQLKLFKRQSYHAAIAYNIHIKQFHSGTHPSAKNIDPTFNSRKLRQMAVPS